jgi:hypothetical protein
MCTAAAVRRVLVDDVLVVQGKAALAKKKDADKTATGATGSGNMEDDDGLLADTPAKKNDAAAAGGKQSDDTATEVGLLVFVDHFWLRALPHASMV